MRSRRPPPSTRNEGARVPVFTRLGPIIEVDSRGNAFVFPKSMLPLGTSRPRGSRQGELSTWRTAPLPQALGLLPIINLSLQNEINLTFTHYFKEQELEQPIEDMRITTIRRSYDSCLRAQHGFMLVSFILLQNDFFEKSCELDK